MTLRVQAPPQLPFINLKNKKTILRKKSGIIKVRESLDEFFHDRILEFLSDEFNISPHEFEPSFVCYEPVWTRKNHESFIKTVRLKRFKEECTFTSLDICIVESYNLDMFEIVKFLNVYNAKKVKFKFS